MIRSACFLHLPDLPFQLADPCFGGVEPLQSGIQFGLQAEQLFFGVRFVYAVLAAEGIDVVQPSGNGRQPFRVDVHPVPPPFALFGQVFEFRIEAGEPFFQLFRRRVLFRQPGKGRGHAFDAGDDAALQRPVVRCQQIRAVIQSLGDLFGVGQQVLFLFEFPDFAAAQFQGL